MGYSFHYLHVYVIAIVDLTKSPVVEAVTLHQRPPIAASKMITRDCCVILVTFSRFQTCEY